MTTKDDYIYENLIEIRFADPISSMNLNKDFMIMGTMMGRITIYNFKTQNIMVLSELNSENISDISYNIKENSFYVGVGDEEIKVFKADNLSNESSQSINVYKSDNEHIQNCENAFILLSPDSLLRIQLAQIDEGTLTILDTEQEYELKYFNPNNENNNFSGKLPMTNYSVPFDFNGKNFLWIEFLGSGNRKICVANIETLSVNSEPYKFELDKNFGIGHISHAKLLSNNKIFIVHSLNICEIRVLDNNFTLFESFIHKGEEVYAFDIYYNEEKNDISSKKDKDIIKYNKYNQFDKDNINSSNNFNEIKLSQIDTKRVQTIQIEEASNENIQIDTNLKKVKSFDIKKMNIITLDINGNINVYQNKIEKNLFNLYNLNEISIDLKEKHFFSMGYAYYIKSDLNYFCISSDHGCFIIKKKYK